MGLLITSNLQEYPYRVTLITSIFFIMLFFVHLEYIFKLLYKILKFALPIFFVFVVIVSNINVDKFLLLKTDESKFLNDKVRYYIQNDMKTDIIFKQPKNDLHNSADEFYRYTSEYDFDIVPALYFIFDNLKYKLPNIEIVQSSVDLQLLNKELGEYYILDTNEMRNSIESK
jgi:hypothetical protein